MSFDRPSERVTGPAPGGVAGPHIAIILAAVLAAAAIAAIGTTLPSPLILPVGSILTLALAALIALVAWKAPRVPANRVTYWDVSGALTLIGIVAALLSEPEHVLPLLETADRNN